MKTRKYRTPFGKKNDGLAMSWDTWH